MAELDSEHLFKVWEINAEREREKDWEKEREERGGEAERKGTNRTKRSKQCMFTTEQKRHFMS